MAEVDITHGRDFNAVRAELIERLDVRRPEYSGSGTSLKYRSRIFWVDGTATQMETRADRYRRVGADDELRATRTNLSAVASRQYSPTR